MLRGVVQETGWISEWKWGWKGYYDVRGERTNILVGHGIGHSKQNIYEEWHLLGCYAVWLLSEQKFRRNLAPTSSGRQESVS
jgi:hypothetical protein